MKANIFVDPAIIATPGDDLGRDGIVEWLTNLDIWLKEALSAHFLWLHSTTITNALETYGRFPSYVSLRDIQRKYYLDINLASLARRVNDFFRNPGLDLEDKLEQLGCMAELQDDSVTIQPELMVTRWPDFIYPNIYTLLATSCVCKHAAHPFAHALRIATLKFPDQSRMITITATITYTIPELACKPGDVITQAFPLLYSPDDLLPLIDILTLWEKGDREVLYIIEQQIKKDWYYLNGSPLPFSLGGRFVKSVNGVGLGTNEIVLRRIMVLAAAVVTDQIKHIENAELHPLETHRGSKIQRKRESDQASAWRVDVTKHGAGWRLHYWHIPGPDGGSIEFSNVCKESDATIYE